MKIYLLAAGTRMPVWVTQGYQEYAKRLPKGFLRLIEIPVGKRAAGGNVERARDKEGDKMLTAVPVRGRIIAMDVTGKSWSTDQAAARLKHWMRQGDDIALLVGGPDGLAASCVDRSHESWSLSPLTLPHGLARVVLAEQLYRAWSILQGAPYHRG